MANSPNYSLRGQRINFNDLRAQTRRQDVEVSKPKKPARKEDVEDRVEDQQLLVGFTPAPIPEKVAPAPAPVAPAPAPRPTLTAPAPKPAPAPAPKADDATIDE